LPQEQAQRVARWGRIDWPVVRAERRESPRESGRPVPRGGSAPTIDHVPVNTGARFSRNAVIASATSDVAKHVLIWGISWRSWDASEVSALCPSRRLVSANATGGPFASDSA